MLPISEGSHETWNFYWSSITSVNSHVSSVSCDDAGSSARSIVVGIPSIPRASQKIVCTAEIKSILARALLAITDFFSCSGTRVTRNRAIESDLHRLLQSPYKMKLGNWDVIFNKRCAEAKWYGVDVDNVIHSAMLSMESKAAHELKSVCEMHDSLAWLKSAVLERNGKHGEAIKQINDLLKSDCQKLVDVISTAAGSGCSIHSIVGAVINADPLNVWRLLRESSKAKSASSFMLKVVSESVCSKLMSDDDLFDELLNRIDKKDINVFFETLGCSLSGALVAKARTIHLTWIVTERLKYLGGANAPNDTNEFEHCISTSGYDENALRHIFSVAAAKIKMSRNSSADLLSRAKTKYDKWLIDAKHANSLSDDLLISAFDNGLYGLRSEELGISPGDMEVLKTEAHRRAESADTDWVAALTVAVRNSISLDSVWYLLPAVLVAEQHNVRMGKFQKLSGYTPLNDWNVSIADMFPEDRQRILHCLKYLSGKLKDYGKAETGKFLAALLPRFGSLKNGGMLRKSDRKMIAGMLRRHFGKQDGKSFDFKLERFSPSEHKNFEGRLKTIFLEKTSLSKNISGDDDFPFCSQFECDNRGFHMWIDCEPMDGFAARTAYERSEMVVHTLKSRLALTKQQVMTLSKLCTQDIANEVVVQVTNQKIFLMSMDEENALGISGAPGDHALNPITTVMEQIISKKPDGTATVTYFLFKDNLDKLMAAPDSVLLNPQESEFYGELTFDIAPDGEFEITGDIVVGLKKTIVGLSDN